MITNNLTRMLEAKKISFQAYELPAEKLGAVETAHILGVPLDVVYKTIVVLREGKGKPVLAVIPGTGDVDLKALAKALGEKKLRLPSEREAEQITGLQAGGISPLALINKGFQVVIDAAAQEHADEKNLEVFDDGGVVGVDFEFKGNGLFNAVQTFLV